MNDKSLFGFLVVLSEPEYLNPRNPRYFGVDAIPASPSGIPEEAEALDRYVFGHYKDPETNVIPTYEKARELLDALSSSPRRFEIIFCGTGPDDPALHALTTLIRQDLGYDVAGISGDCWSIVDDIPESDWAKPYIAILNESGLFPTRSNAERYLGEYRENQETDFDSNFNVVFVARIKRNAQTEAVQTKGR